MQVKQVGCSLMIDESFQSFFLNVKLWSVQVCKYEALLRFFDDNLKNDDVESENNENNHSGTFIGELSYVSSVYSPYFHALIILFVPFSYSGAQNMF